MHLLDLFESTNEGYTVTRGIDRDRYQERTGLEGPFQTKSGKVVYYDKKEGKYYDPDSDMYIDHDDYAELDEGVGTYLKGAVLAGLLGLGVNQMASMTDAKNSPLGQAMAQAAEQGDEYAAKHLEKLDAYFDLNDTGSIKVLSQKYLGKTLESVYEEVATNKRTERILGLLRAKNPAAENDLEALILSFDQGQKQDRKDINTLYSQNSEEDREIEALEKELERIKKKRAISEDYYETDEQRELARLGRILKDLGKKRDDDVGTAMGFLGTQLTRFGTPQGVNSIEKLEQVTGLPESVIMKMMALAQKVQGDVAVGDETAGNDEDDEEVKTEGYQDSLKNKIGRASDEFDVGTDNYEVKIDGKPWKVFRTKSAANKAASTIEMRYGKKTTVFATRKPVSEGTAKDFDEKFRKHLDLYTKSQKVRDYKADKAQQNLDRMKAMDPGNINPLIIDKPKAHKKAREKGVPQSVISTNRNPTLPEEVALDENASLVKDYQDMKAQGKKDHNIIDVLMSMPKYKRMSRDQMTKIIGDAKRKGIFKEAESPIVKMTIPNTTPGMAQKMERLAKENNVEFSKQGNTVSLKGRRIDMTTIRTTMGIAQTNIPVELVNEAEVDIKIGDTVQTLKMGQMQGTVTGFSKKGGIDKVMFKHESGKVYATVPENLRVIDSVNEGGFFDPDKPNIGDMVKHRNGAVGKVKKIGTQGDETHVYFRDENGEMNYGQWKKHVFPMEDTAKKTESLDDTVVEADINESSLWDFGKRFKEKMAPRIKDFFGNHGYKVTSGPNGYMLHAKNGVAVELINYPTMGPVIMFNQAHDKPNAPEKRSVIELVKKLGRIISTPGNTTAFGIAYKNGDQVLDVLNQVEELSSTVAEAKKKPVPTKPDKWAYAKAEAKKKFDVYPSAYANAWAAKKYKELGGGWRMGKKK